MTKWNPPTEEVVQPDILIIPNALLGNYAHKYTPASGNGSVCLNCGLDPDDAVHGAPDELC